MEPFQTITWRVFSRVQLSTIKTLVKRYEKLKTRNARARYYNRAETYPYIRDELIAQYTRADFIRNERESLGERVV
jgi:hypothetical protein